nr:LysR family transcriptional regulator [Burkholderia multivorans]
MATARLGSFTAAAVSIGVTKSAIGKSITRLEERLGVRLFHRSTRRLSLTSDGETFLTACSTIVSELEAAENALNVERAVPSGRLTIDLPSAFGRQYVMPVLLDLMAKHSGLAVIASFTDRRIDLMEEGLDLAIRIGAPPDTTELKARRIGTQRLVVCSAPSYFEQRPVPLTKEELADHRCIVGRRNRARSAWLLQDSGGKSIRYPVTGFYELGDGDAMLDAALAGLGLAQLPTWLAGTHLRSGALVPVLGDISGGEVPIVAMWPAARHVPPRVTATVEALTTAFSTIDELSS